MIKDFFEDIKKEKPELEDLIDIIKDINNSSIEDVINVLEKNNFISYKLDTNDKKDS